MLPSDIPEDIFDIDELPRIQRQNLFNNPFSTFSQKVKKKKGKKGKKRGKKRKR
jgi:hypothetical protein